jgi:GNAT superfamily N-acetyltransferase
MIVRKAEERDLDAIREIAASYGNLANWPRRPDYLDHELSSAGLAVRVDRGEIAGFGAVIERTGVAHLADLFVRPDRRGTGIGRAILMKILASDGQRVTFASGDPRALPLYIGFGMLPIAPLLYMTGTSDAADKLPDPDVRLVEAGPGVLADHDRSASGRGRLQDLEFLERAGASGFLSLRGETVVGYGICRLVDPTTDGRAAAFLGPVGAPDTDGAASTSLALLRWAAAHANRMTIAVFGPNPVVPVLLTAGFRIDDVDTLMASHGGLLDVQRYFPSAELG